MVKFPSTSMPDPDWWHALWPDPLGLIRTLDVKPGAVAVDLCCGDGYFTVPMASIASRVYGIDLDIPKQIAVPNCQWIRGDAMNLLELVSEQVDFILIANTFHGVPEKDSMLRICLTVLKPDGELTIINWHKRPREETRVLGTARGPATGIRMSPDEVLKLAELEGFCLKKIVDLPPYHYAIVLQK